MKKPVSQPVITNGIIEVILAVVKHPEKKQVPLKQLMPFVQYVIREYPFTIIEEGTNDCLNKKQQLFI